METRCYGNQDAGVVLLQLVGEHDADHMQEECSLLQELSGRTDFCLIAVKVEDWNRDLSPWQAPAVFGKEAFGGAAEHTIAYLKESVLPTISPQKKLLLGGYSLAGLFALWASTRLDRVCGVAAVSPSVWFPDFLPYVKANPPKTSAIYLSLGDREERTRNPVMSTVGSCIRTLEQEFTARNYACKLEWNQGNHFMEPEKRTAKGFAWLLEQVSK